MNLFYDAVMVGRRQDGSPIYAKDLREELKRLRSDSAELARVRDLAKEAIDFAEELGEESDKLARYAGSTGDGGDHEKPIAELRARLDSHPAMTKPSKAPEGFALVPVEPTPEMLAAIVREADKQESYWAYKPEQFYRAMLAAATKGDSHE